MKVPRPAERAWHNRPKQHRNIIHQLCAIVHGCARCPKIQLKVDWERGREIGIGQEESVDKWGGAIDVTRSLKRALVRPTGLLGYAILALVLFVSSSASAWWVVADLDALPRVDVKWRAEGRSQFAEATEPVQGSVTLHTTMRVGKPGVSRDVEALLLGVIRVGAHDGPEGLRLSWGPSASGWGVTWSLKLESDLGLLDPSGSGGATRTTTPLASRVPFPGHVYESFLSYDAETDTISILVADLTAGEPVYQGAIQVAPLEGEFFASAGVLASVPRGAATTGGRSEDEQVDVALETLRVLPIYLPVGVDWRVGTPIGEDGVLQTWRFEADENIGIRIMHSGALPRGSFRLLSEEGDTRTHVGEFSRGTTESLLILDRSDLPLGTFNLWIEYVVDGRPLLADFRTITIGHVQVSFDAIDVDRVNGEIRGTVSVTSSSPLTGVELTLDAALHRLAWDDETRDFSESVYMTRTLVDRTLDIGPAAQPLSFVLPLPAEPGTWELTIETTSRQSLGMSVVGERKLFSTYPPADPQPGEPFVIAVLPDTQGYAQDYPTIFLRQAQWLAEQAADRNILLMLHVGDITNTSEAYQWERAVDSIRLLDGVMPYLLAQGNHDMAIGSAGMAADRHTTAINQYFPIESMPWIKGTFPEGRIENAYATFEFQGEKFLFVTLEFGPRDEALDWANDVVAAHPDHTTIMMTHANINSVGDRTESATTYPIARNPETTVNGGTAIWEKFTRRHPNLLMTLSGHIHSNAIPRRVSRGVQGNVIYEMLMDYQNDPNGGNGYLVLMEFRPDETIEIRAYSPFLGQYRTDTQHGFTNHFIIERGSVKVTNP